MEKITQIINQTIKDYIKKYPFDFDNNPRTPKSINTGYCYDFAEDVLNQLGLNYDQHTGHTEDYWTSDGKDYFSFKRLKKFNNEDVPEGIKVTKDLVRELGRATHAWIEYNNKYYDSECPEGCDRLMDLPIFKDIIDYHRFLQKQEKTPTPLSGLLD